MLFEALLLGWVLLFSAVISIGVTMLATALILKDGLDNIDGVNLVMVEVCVFAVVLIITFMILGS